MIFQTLLALFVPLWAARFLKLLPKINSKHPSPFTLLLSCSYILWNLFNIISAFRNDIFFLTNTSTHSPSFILKRNYRMYIEKAGHDFLEFDSLLEKLPEHQSKITELLDSFGIKALRDCFACYSNSHYIMFYLYHTLLDYFYFLIIVGILTIGHKNNVRLVASLSSGIFLVVETLWITLGDQSIDSLYSLFEHDRISHFTLNQVTKAILYTTITLLLSFLKFDETSTDSKIRMITDLSRTIILQLRQLNRIQVVHRDSKDGADTEIDK